MVLKNQKKIISAWAMFDWANSAYSLVITSTIFPAYYTIITTTQEHGDKVYFFGKRFTNTALSNYALSVSYLIMIFLLPILSSIADIRGNKKMMMKFFTYIGGCACIALVFFKLETLEFGIICFSIAAMGYVGGVLFNNAYLPEIASMDRQDQVSAQGFTYGYIGSVLLQIICFFFVFKPDLFGITDPSLPARLSFLLVGVWWIGFAQIPFFVLSPCNLNDTLADRKRIDHGFRKLITVWKRLGKIILLRQYLLAFFFYSVGVQTIMLAAAGFGAKVLHLATSKLIAIVLIIQLVAIAGTMIVSFFAKKIGNIKVLIAIVLVWIGACIYAYYIHTEQQFYVLAIIVGIVMGGIQCLSRSTYSKFIPENTSDTASFFSFYDVVEKLAIVVGLFSFAYIEEITGDMRNSALSLSTFFLVSLILLLRLSYKTPISFQHVISK